MGYPASRYVVLFSLVLSLTPLFAHAQEKSSPAGEKPAGPPMGFVKAEKTLLVERTELNGRIEAVNFVTLTARLNAVLEQQHFDDGAEVKKDQLLFTLEQGPFQAEVEARKAAVAQAEAQLENANLTLARAEELLEKKAGSQSTADTARAAQKSQSALLDAAKAQLQAAEINLAYTEIRSPIDGRISRALIKPGNLVTPGTPLTNVVSQDPTYISFPISVRTFQEIGDKAALKDRTFPSTIRLRLMNGDIYEHIGKLDFIDNSISLSTDTIMLRGIIDNPIIPKEKGGNGALRRLVHNEYVTVFVEDSEGIPAILIPSAAIMTTKAGNSVIVIGDDNVPTSRPITLGRMEGLNATVTSGIKVGERIAVDGFHFLMGGQKLVVTPIDKSQPTPTRER